MEKRRLIASVVFALGVSACGIWAYREVSWMFDPSIGSGNIAGVGLGLLGALFTLVPPIVTILLARLSGSRLARWWRNAHLVATLALIIVPMMTSSLYALIISILVFPPVAVFFVVGSIAIWIASPRTQPAAAES
jgi:hypothetical protein